MIITLNYGLTRDQVMREMYNCQSDYDENAIHNYDDFVASVTKEMIFEWLLNNAAAKGLDVIENQSWVIPRLFI